MNWASLWEHIGPIVLVVLGGAVTIAGQQWTTWRDRKSIRARAVRVAVDAFVDQFHVAAAATSISYAAHAAKLDERVATVMTAVAATRNLEACAFRCYALDSKHELWPLVSNVLKLVEADYAKPADQARIKSALLELLDASRAMTP